MWFDKITRGDNSRENRQSEKERKDAFWASLNKEYPGGAEKKPQAARTDSAVNSVTTAPPPAYSDAELEAMIRRLKPKIRRNEIIASVVSVLGFIGMIYMRITEDLIFLIPFFITLCVGMGFGGAAARDKKKLKLSISDSIVRSVLSEKFELLQYFPTGSIPQQAIQYAGLINGWNQMKGSDYIKGVYKGVGFMFSDVHLENVTKRAKGGENRATVFRGQWLILETQKELPWGVMLKERMGGRIISEKSDVETENIEFNKRFQIIAPNPHTAFYILTPHFMEYIMKADNRANSKTNISFDGRQIHVALHNGRDLFEPGGKKHFKADNIHTLRMQMKWDVNFITGIIDEFLLNERLFEKII